VSKAFVSFISQSRGGLLGPRGKLAHIWFDELFIQEFAPALRDELFLSPALEKKEISLSVADELRKIWKVVACEIPEGAGAFVVAKDANEKLFLDAAWRVVMNETAHLDDRDDRPVGGGMMRPPAIRADIIANLIGSLATWWTLNSMDSCGIVPEPKEQKVVDATLRVTQNNQFGTFSRFVEQRIPDLNSLSWERVLELRHHPKLADFRKKLDTLQKELDGKDASAAAQLLQELELKDLREFAMLCKPQRRECILRGLASNVPLPIPVNPASIVLSGMEIKRTYQLDKRFGWLYFGLDLCHEK
jgi:hypothetical protein